MATVKVSALFRIEKCINCVTVEILSMPTPLGVKTMYYITSNVDIVI